MAPVPFRVAAAAAGDRATRGRSSSSPSRASRSRPAPGQFTMLYAFGIGEVPISVSGGAAARSSTPSAPSARSPRRSARRGRAPCSACAGRSATRGRSRRRRAATSSSSPAASGSRRSGPRSTTLLERRGEYGEVALLYGAARPPISSTARELERWRGRCDLQVDVTVDTADGGWRGKVGVVPKLDRRRALRSGVDRRARLRAGDHDALRRAARCSSAGVAAGADLPLDGAQHAAAASATAATASSARR